MYYKIFILLLLNFRSFGKTQTSKIERFSCDSKEKYDEIANSKETFKRFFIHDNQVYFIFQNRIIYTKLFELDENSHSLQNKTTFVNQNFFEQKNIEENSSDQFDIFNDMHVVGYLYSENSNKTYEFYKNETDDLNQIYKFAYELDFKETFGMRKTKRLITEITISQPFPSLVEKLIKESRLKWFNAIDTKYGETFFAKIDHWAKLNHEIITKYNLLRFGLIKSIGSINYLEIEELPKIKFFVSYINQQNISGSGGFSGENNFVFIGINENNFKILFEYDIVNFIDKKLSPFEHTGRFQNELTFEELFSCHTPFNHERQIKGFFYDKKSGLFFVFIKRFYLKIERNLIVDYFYILDEDYDQNAHELEFENELDHKNVRFEILNRKWIYSLPFEVLFRPFLKTFKLQLQNTDQKLIIKSSSNNRLGNCLSQVLLIETVLFCFSESDYFVMKEMATSIGTIKSIFRNVTKDVNWDKQRLLFIFNYESGKLIFLTQDYALIFNHSSFKIQNASTSEIVYKSTDYSKYQNCLLKKEICKPIIVTTVAKPTSLETESTSNESPIRTKNPTATTNTVLDGKITFNLVFYLVGVLIIILAIVLAIYYWRIRNENKNEAKNEAKNEDKDSNKFSNPSDDESARNSSFIEKYLFKKNPAKKRLDGAKSLITFSQNIAPARSNSPLSVASVPSMKSRETTTTDQKNSYPSFQPTTMGKISAQNNEDDDELTKKFKRRGLLE